MATGDAADVKAKFWGMIAKAATTGSFVQRAIELRDAGIPFDPAAMVASETGADVVANALLALDLTDAWWANFLAALDARFIGAAAVPVVAVAAAASYTVPDNADVVLVTYTGTGACAVELSASRRNTGRELVIVDTGGATPGKTITISGGGGVGGPGAYVISQRGGFAHLVPSDVFDGSTEHTGWAVLAGGSNTGHLPKWSRGVTETPFLPAEVYDLLAVQVSKTTDVTVKIPTAWLTARRQVVVWDQDQGAATHNIRIEGEGAQDINGASYVTIAANGGKLTFVPTYSGAGWHAY